MLIFPFILKELPFFFCPKSPFLMKHIFPALAFDTLGSLRLSVHIPAKLLKVPHQAVSSAITLSLLVPGDCQGSEDRCCCGWELGELHSFPWTSRAPWAWAGSLFPQAILEQEDRPHVGGFEETSFWLSCFQLALGFQVLVLRQPGSFAPDRAGSHFMCLPDNASAALVWSRCLLGGCCLLVLSLPLIQL